MRYKGLFIILDGLGDRPHFQLQGKTPLEAASTPSLDNLAASGQCGLMDPLMPGIPVDTHTGVSILFGLSPYDAAKLSRGPVEAAGINLKLEEGDVLLRANFATAEHEEDNKLGLIDRRAGRISEGMEELCTSLRDLEVGNNIVANLYPATQHRAVLHLRGDDLSAEITDTDPGGLDMEQGVLRSKPLKHNDQRSLQTANAVNQFITLSNEILQNHPINIERLNNHSLPANCVLTRGAGVYVKPKTITSYLGLKGAVVAGEKTILGLAKLFEFTPYTNEQFTSLGDTDIDLKLRTAILALESHDLVYVHLKGTDIAAHDKDPIQKKYFIERVDKALQQIQSENLVIGVTADHSTDSIRGEHNGDSVPCFIHNPEGRKDLVMKYDEMNCIAGSLGRLTGQQYLTSFLDAMGVMHNYKVSDFNFFMQL